MNPPTYNTAFTAVVPPRPHPALPPETRLTTENRVLEIRSYWGNVLMGVNHFATPKAVTLGEAKGTDYFISSEGLPVETFPLVRCEHGDYLLTFTRQMTGEVEIDGQPCDLETLRGSPLAPMDSLLADSYCLALPLNTRALIHWGGITLAMRFVSPPAAIPTHATRGLDFVYLNVLVFSLVAHFAALATLTLYPTDAEPIWDDLYVQHMDRIIDFMDKPPKPSNQDLIALLNERITKKPAPQAPKRPKPAEARPSDTEGVPTKSPATPTKINREKTDHQRQAEVRRRFDTMFKTDASGRKGSLLAGRSGGTISGALTSVISTRNHDSAAGGLAGLGIRSTGPSLGGGFGISQGIAGIETDGRAGGDPTYGGGFQIRKKRRHDIVELLPPKVEGNLTRQQIQKVIDTNKEQIRYCYERSLQRDQRLAGRLQLTWVIAATGRVAGVKVRESTMDSREVERCVERKIAAWIFPAPNGGGTVEVNYPIIFDRA